MGLATCFVLGALAWTVPAPAVEGGASGLEEQGPRHRFEQLAPGTLVVEADVGVYLSFPTYGGTPEEPLQIAVTGLYHGAEPFELDRRTFTQRGEAWALVRYDELAIWDEVVVSYAGTGLTGAPQGGFLARVTGPQGSGGLSETPFGSGGSIAATNQKELNGTFVLYSCPKTKKEDCTVHFVTVNPQNGALVKDTEKLPPGQNMSVSVSMPAAHHCTGCG